MASLKMFLLTMALCFTFEMAHEDSLQCNINSLGPFVSVYEQMLATLKRNICKISPKYPPDRGNDVHRVKFDFIVVGAGSAGSAVAARLSEVKEWNVLLIEAGNNPPIESDVPRMLWSLLNSEYDWGDSTEPSDHSCLAMNKGRCRWPRGKMLGGSSSMNAMLYVRGMAKDYDRWAVDNPGWSYADVRKYFVKLENYTLPTDFVNDHGEHGAVHVERYREKALTVPGKLRKLIIKAAKELGLKHIESNNRNQTIGVTTVPGTLVDGKRANTARAYLTPLTHGRGENLYVLKNATVARILIDSNKRAYGVEYYKDGIAKRIVCTKELIVSAGSFNSPQILMLSGIGPKRHLSALNITAIVDLEVGKNLHDHQIFVGFPLLIDNKYDEHPRDSDVTDEDLMYNYLTRNTDYASVGTLDTMWYNNTEGNSDEPNLQFHTINFPANTSQLNDFLLGVFNIDPKYIGGMLDANRNNHVLILTPTLINPKSRGQVRLRSTNPFDRPQLISGYYDDDEDMRLMLKGVEITYYMTQTNAMLHHVSILNFTLDACKGEYLSAEYWTCYLQHLTSTIFHQVGTCKMGPKHDRSSVVDAELKVHGIEGLRVADASIMPTIVSGNTNIATIMIGEKAAQMIIDKWKGNNK